MAQAAVDNMLVAADTNVVSWASEKSVALAGLNAAPSATGLAAKSSLEGKGVTVTVN